VAVGWGGQNRQFQHLDCCITGLFHRQPAEIGERAPGFCRAARRTVSVHLRRCGASGAASAWLSVGASRVQIMSESSLAIGELAAEDPSPPLRFAAGTGRRWMAPWASRRCRPCGDLSSWCSDSTDREAMG
jgi:hypothetical protein